MRADFGWLTLSLFVVAVSSKLCNQETAYECHCRRCHKLFEESRNDSIIIEFDDCPDINDLNLEHLRNRLASWLKEECSFILRCAQPYYNLSSKNVLISELFCATGGLNSRLGLFVRWNATRPIHEKKNQVDFDSLISVLRAREHLISESLNSAQIIRMGKGSEIVPEKRILYSFGQLVFFAGVSALATFVFSSLFVLCVAWNLVGWNRLRHGLWKQKAPSLAQLNKELRLRTRDQLQEIPMNRLNV